MLRAACCVLHAAPAGLSKQCPTHDGSPVPLRRPFYEQMLMRKWKTRIPISAPLRRTCVCRQRASSSFVRLSSFELVVQPGIMINYSINQSIMARPVQLKGGHAQSRGDQLASPHHSFRHSFRDCNLKLRRHVNAQRSARAACHPNPTLGGGSGGTRVHVL